MNWHIIVRFGAEDRFMPDIPTGTGVFIVHLEGGEDMQRVRTTLLQEAEKNFGRRPVGPALDLLLCAIGVYCADMCLSRENSAHDRWTRCLTLHLPVVDLARWGAITPTVCRLLGYLTGDEWEIRHRAREEHPAQVIVLPDTECREVCLFSGGLDSTAGAIDLLATNKQLLLVGHYGAGMTHTFQDRVLGELQAAYPDMAQPMFVHLQPPQLPEEAEHENTARSRSFLFISLGVIAAHLTAEGTPIHIPENGLISLNVPMTATRLGSLSTRTTHPHFVALFRTVLDGLALNHPLLLPYQFQTKGEMLRCSSNPDLLRRLTPLTMSCAHPENVRWGGGTPGTHCGHCLPCLVRRAAVLAAGYPDATYHTDVRRSPPAPDSDRGRDFRAVSMAIERSGTYPVSRFLFEVLNGGPIPTEAVHESVKVYRRGMDELRNLLQGGTPSDRPTSDPPA